MSSSRSIGYRFIIRQPFIIGRYYMSLDSAFLNLMFSYFIRIESVIAFWHLSFIFAFLTILFIFYFYISRYINIYLQLLSAFLLFIPLLPQLIKDLSFLFGLVCMSFTFRISFRFSFLISLIIGIFSFNRSAFHSTINS